MARSFSGAIYTTQRTQRERVESLVLASLFLSLSHSIPLAHKFSLSSVSLMAALVCVVMLMLALVGVSDGAWCVCRSDVSDTTLQKALDYACGAGADCSTIQQGGGCFNPNTVRAHCSYAVNSYYQRKGQNQQACDFSGAATLTSTDPSSNGCTYPASSSAAGTSGSNSSSSSSSTSNSPPSSTSNSPPGSSTPTSTTPGSSSGSTTPNTFTPTTGTGGVLGGLGPSGSTITTDSSDGGPEPALLVGSLLAVLLLSVLDQIQELI